MRTGANQSRCGKGRDPPPGALAPGAVRHPPLSTSTLHLRSPPPDPPSDTNPLLPPPFTPSVHPLRLLLPSCHLRNSLPASPPTHPPAHPLPSRPPLPHTLPARSRPGLSPLPPLPTSASTTPPPGLSPPPNHPDLRSPSLHRHVMARHIRARLGSMPPGCLPNTSRMSLTRPPNPFHLAIRPLPHTTTTPPPRPGWFPLPLGTRNQPGRFPGIFLATTLSRSHASLPGGLPLRPVSFGATPPSTHTPSETTPSHAQSRGPESIAWAR